MYRAKGSSPLPFLSKNILKYEDHKYTNKEYLKSITSFDYSTLLWVVRERN